MLEYIKQNYKALIDDTAKNVRYKHMTLNMDDIYREKAAQAIEYAAANYPSDTSSYPFVQAEANATGDTPQYAADSIISARQKWMEKMADIEEVRRRGKVEIDIAITEKEIISAKDRAISALTLL